MNITNDKGLPAPIFRAITAHHHRQGGDYSASGLGKSPRQHWLGKRHSKEVVADASEMVWAFDGQMRHSIMERAARPGLDLPEHYMEIEVMGKKISGSCDLFETDTGKLWDLKTVSVWSVIYMSSLKSWTEQTNIYAYMLRNQLMTYQTQSISVIAYCKDWDKKKAGDEGYPKSPIIEIPIELWSPDKTQKHLEERVSTLEAAKDLDDASLPTCTDEDLWRTPDTWAIQKPGAKRATRVYENAMAAWNHLATDESLEIVHRKGEAKKCGYCNGAQWCNQFREMGGVPKI